MRGAFSTLQHEGVAHPLPCETLPPLPPLSGARRLQRPHVGEAQVHGCTGRTREQGGRAAHPLGGLTQKAGSPWDSLKLDVRWSDNPDHVRPQ